MPNAQTTRHLSIVVGCAALVGIVILGYRAVKSGHDPLITATPAEVDESVDAPPGFDPHFDAGVPGSLAASSDETAGVRHAAGGGATPPADPGFGLAPVPPAGTSPGPALPSLPIPPTGTEYALMSPPAGGTLGALPPPAEARVTPDGLGGALPSPVAGGRSPAPTPLPAPGADGGYDDEDDFVNPVFTDTPRPPAETPAPPGYAPLHPPPPTGSSAGAGSARNADPYGAREYGTAETRYGNAGADDGGAAAGDDPFTGRAADPRVRDVRGTRDPRNAADPRDPGGDRRGSAAPDDPAPDATRPAPPLPDAAPRTYRIRSGDTLSDIAARELGSIRHWEAIARANRDRLPDPAFLVPGTEIVLPVIRATPARPADHPAGDGGDGRPAVDREGRRVYIVQAGDTLSGIAQRELGSARRWEDIAKLNRAALPNPADLKPGREIVLPDAAAARDPAPRFEDRRTEEEPILPPRAVPPIEGERYEVRRGDTLAGIARAKYGDPRLAGRVMQVNERVLAPTRGRLEPGMALHLPPMPGGGAAEPRPAADRDASRARAFPDDRRGR